MATVVVLTLKAAGSHAQEVPILDAFAFDRSVNAEAFADEVARRFASDLRADCSPEALAVPDSAVLASKRDGGAGGDRPVGMRDSMARADEKRQRDLRRAVVALQTGLSGVPEGSSAGAAAVSDSALVRLSQRAILFRQSDPVLRCGALSVLVASGEAVAFERTLDGDRRIVAVNRGDRPAFLQLPGDGVPPPLVPAFVSRDDAGRVPALVAVLDDGVEGILYGLQIPARTTVIYRPAASEDVRPKGLDE